MAEMLLTKGKANVNLTEHKVALLIVQSLFPYITVYITGTGWPGTVV